MTSFLDDLQRQLVAASRSLWLAQPAATNPSPRWWRSVRRSCAVLIGALVVAGTAVAATTQLVGERDDSLGVLKRMVTMPDGTDHRYVRAHGLNPADARLAFVTPAGLDVYSVRDSEATCIMVSDGDDQCYRATSIGSGRGFTLGNDCSAGSDRPMRIAGAAPAGTERVRVAYSRGPGRTMNVVHGIFVIDTTTPTQDEPHPVALEFLDADDATILTSAIANGGDLCLGRSPS